MSKSFVYTNRAVYQLLMRLLYGSYFEARYRAIAAEIPNGSEVVDVCAGDAYLYHKYLRQKSVLYLGLDLSPQLVKWSNRHGICMRQFDLWQDTVPTGDIVVMQASLYQFIPHTEVILNKLLEAARQKVIVSEPTRNLAGSQNRFLAWLSRQLTTPLLTSEEYTGQRFTEETLLMCFQQFDSFQKAFFVPGDREMVGVFKIHS
jgi:hypothetical protein